MNSTTKAGVVLTAVLHAIPVFGQTIVHASGGAGSQFIEKEQGTGNEPIIQVDEFFLPYRISSSVFDAISLRHQPRPDSYLLQPSEITLGYAWRNLRVERSVTESSRIREREAFDGLARLLSKSNSRLSYNLQSNWQVRLSRGRFTKPERLDPSEGIKRTMLSTTYQYPFESSRWQTTLAYGYSGKKPYGYASDVYLLETLLQVKDVHTFFGRAERATADELFSERETLHGRNFVGNRFTLGYVYDMADIGPVRFSIGGLVTKRSVPNEHVALVGKDPAAYKLFARLLIQLP
jgi:hypothetical protein